MIKTSETIYKLFAAGPTSVDTAIGTFSGSMGGFVSQIARIAVGLGGVAAIGLLAYGGFTVLTSTGDPEKLVEGREIITQALMGLALIVLAVVILQWIGWDIIGIGRLTGVNLNNL